MLNDRFLRPIKVGDTIAYPGRAGSSCWITTGTVTEVLEERPADLPEWRHWHPKLRLDGGSQGVTQKQLGQRTVGYTCDMIILSRAGDG